MTAPGWEGERAQECIAACFHTTAAAKRPLVPLSHKPCPTTLSSGPTVGWPTAACSTPGGAGDTNHSTLGLAHGPTQPTSLSICPQAPWSRVTLGSAPTLHNRLADITELSPPALYLRLYLCVCSIQAVQKHKTQPNTKPHHSVHGLLTMKGCSPACTNAEGCPTPGPLPGQGHKSPWLSCHITGWFKERGFILQGSRMDCPSLYQLGQWLLY